MQNYRYDYFIFTRKVKAGVDAVQVLILGAECCLQLIIKILLEIHQSDYRSFGRSCSMCFGKGCWFALNEMGKVVLLH
jgi:hypothetical protein